MYSGDINWKTFYGGSISQGVTSFDYSTFQAESVHVTPEVVLVDTRNLERCHQHGCPLIMTELLTFS